MKLKEIYENSIDRPVNPAVSAEDRNADVIRTEIEEYVFTDEIINSLYLILQKIRDRDISLAAIWISGFYGSGKSHFLKYLSFCIDENYSKRAMQRLMETVEEHDPLTNPESKSNIEPAEMRELVNWYKDAQVDIILFNIEDYFKHNKDNKDAFVDIFFKMFNRHQGFNSFDIALAQIFEKKLADDGLFDKFKEKVAEEGFNWERQGYKAMRAEQDTILNICKEVDSAMSIDGIKATLNKGDYDTSIKSFVQAVQEYIAAKDDKYRMIFLVDEVSQFMGDDTGLQLNLQQIVQNLTSDADKKVFTVCTSQETQENIGKIIDRFPVQISLSSTDPQYITKKRVLEKNSKGIEIIGAEYDANKNAIEQQFQMPSSVYSTYTDKDNFIDYYPFIPYQLILIEKVFNAFQEIGYLKKTVAGNERSIIRITHDVGIQTEDQAVGPFISFDQFYPMFAAQLIFSGNNAIKNANKVAEQFTDREFALRVTHVLFMICNLQQNEQANFPATVDNLVLLLLREVDTNRAVLIDKVKQVLEYLMHANVVKREISKNNIEIFSFYSDDEAQVAKAIENQAIDDSNRAEAMKSILFRWLDLGVGMKRFSWRDSNFDVQYNVFGKDYGSNKPDIEVSFELNSDAPNADVYALRNNEARLGIFMTNLFNQNKSLKADFEWYVKATSYIDINGNAQSATRAKSLEKFKEQKNDLLSKRLNDQIRALFMKADYISGNCVLQPSEYDSNTDKGNQRLNSLLKTHLQNLYKYAGATADPKYPHDNNSLRIAVKHPIKENEYDLKAMTQVEQLIEDWLASPNRPNEMSLTDIVQHFVERPYGWKDIPILWAVNELVRRGKRDISYNNEPNCVPAVYAEKSINSAERSKFMVSAATDLSPQLLQDTIEAWRYIFANNTIPSANDKRALYNNIHVSPEVKDVMSSIEHLETECSAYPFMKLPRETKDLLIHLLGIRDNKALFEYIIQQKDNLYNHVRETRRLEVFRRDQLKKYKEIRRFLINEVANCSVLSDGQKRIEALRTIETDENSVDNLRLYKKQMDELLDDIDDERDRLRKDIAKKYGEVFDELEKLAADNKVVDACPKRDIEISKRKAPESIVVLKNNLLEANRYRDEQRGVIFNAVKPATPASSTSAGGSSTTCTPQSRLHRTVKHVSAPTSDGPLRTKEDVERYVEKVRNVLMDYINNGKEIYI